MLPYCSDEVLLAELAVVVSTGWELPTRPGRAHDVRHLLLLADHGEALRYGQAAQRFLTMLDVALQPGDEAEPPVSEADSRGLRILFGTHPDYRLERSPTVRRVEASEYLVSAWHDNPPGDRAGSFQRRHQTDALRQALHCLRVQYGQQYEPTSRDYDVIRRHRSYWVGANRQVVRFRMEETIRARLDGLDEYWFAEPAHDEPGFVASRFETTAHPSGARALEVDRVEDMPTRPGYRLVVLRLPDPVEVGDEIDVAWEEVVEFDDAAPRWQRFFAATQCANRGFELTMTVLFETDAELPVAVWPFEATAEVDPTLMANGMSQQIALDASRVASRSWSTAQTEQLTDYGLQWSWRFDVFTSALAK